MSATAKRSTEIIDTVHESETDVRRTARVAIEHRRALSALATVTMRYQVHNELAKARQQSVEARESELRLRRARRVNAGG